MKTFGLVVASGVYDVCDEEVAREAIKCPEAFNYLRKEIKNEIVRKAVGLWPEYEKYVSTEVKKFISNKK